MKGDPPVTWYEYTVEGKSVDVVGVPSHFLMKQYPFKTQKKTLKKSKMHTLNIIIALIQIKMSQ